MQTLHEIFAPNAKKLIATLVVAIFAHLFITVAQSQAAVASELSDVRSFWLTNLINGLPYLETDNTALKFLTFFTLSYGLVWVVSRLVEAGGAIQLAVARRVHK